MGKKIRPYHKRRTATLSGVEIEGELAGQLVCPVIYLWNLGRDGHRSSPLRNLLHETVVWVEAECRNSSGELLYRVRDKGDRKKWGWVTDRFVKFDG